MLSRGFGHEVAATRPSGRQRLVGSPRGSENQVRRGNSQVVVIDVVDRGEWIGDGSLTSTDVLHGILARAERDPEHPAVKDLTRDLRYGDRS